MLHGQDPGGRAIVMSGAGLSPEAKFRLQLAAPPMVGLVMVLVGRAEGEVYASLRLTARPATRTDKAGSFGPFLPLGSAAAP